MARFDVNELQDIAREYLLTNYPDFQSVVMKKTFNQKNEGIVAGVVMKGKVPGDWFILRISFDDGSVVSEDIISNESDYEKKLAQLEKHPLEKDELHKIARSHFDNNDRYKKIKIKKVSKKDDRGKVAGIVKKGMIRGNWFILNVDMTDGSVVSEEIITNKSEYKTRVSQLL